MCQWCWRDRQWEWDRYEDWWREHEEREGFVIESAQKLMDAVEQLDAISKELVATEIVLEELEDEYDDYIENFEAVLWEESLEEDGPKFPAERVRLALAHRKIDKGMYARYRSARRARTRAKQRLSDLREVVAAHRSIVSAAKTELEASEGPQPSWSG